MKYRYYQLLYIHYMGFLFLTSHITLNIHYSYYYHPTNQALSDNSNIHTSDHLQLLLHHSLGP